MAPRCLARPWPSHQSATAPHCLARSLVGSKSPSPTHQWRRRASEGLRPADPRSRLPLAYHRRLWHRPLLHRCQLFLIQRRCWPALIHRRCRLWRLHRRCRLWRLHHRRWQLSLRRSCLRRLAALPPPMAALACPRPPMPLSALAPLADRGAAPANSKNHKNMAAMPHKRNPDMISSQCQWPSCSRESYQKQYESLKKHRRDSSCDQGWQCGVKMPVGTSPSYFQG